MNSEHATVKASGGESAKASITIATANELNQQYQQQQLHSPQQHINNSHHLQQLQLQQQQTQNHQLNEVSFTGK